MFRYLGLLALVLVTAQDAANGLFISPPIPPTGFTEQYYEVRFRVIGLIRPSFSFENLPPFFSGDPTGIVSGTPTDPGTYEFTIKYTDGSQSGSENVVVSITVNPYTAASASQAAAVNFLIIQTAMDSWIYRVGQTITIQLTSKNAVGTLTWTFKNLPLGLTGSNTGKIVGVIKEMGMYSFSVACGDSKGRTAESFYTLNIQPNNLASYSSIVEVPDKNAKSFYTLSQVEASQAAAAVAILNATKKVNEVNASMAVFKSAKANAESSMSLAANQANSATNAAVKSQQLVSDAQINQQKTNTNLNNAKNALDLALFTDKNAKDALVSAKTNFANAKAKFDSAVKVFNESFYNETITLNQQTEAEGRYSKASAALRDAQNVNNIAWTNLQSLRNTLDDANNEWLLAQSKSINAKNAVGLSTQTNDDADSELKIIDITLKKAKSALEEASRIVAGLLSDRNAAKTSLGIANFTVVQAINKLIVAQAAKEAADKATAIAYAQGATSMDILKGNTTYIFAGCAYEVHPTISGTVSVVGLVSQGAVISSGHILTWGDCTTKDQVHIGDTIYYEGQIVSGTISAAVIAKQ